MTTTASSSSSCLLAALSSSGSHIAVVVPSNANNASLLRIQVFQTNTGTLQTTLTHRNNNNNNNNITAVGGGGGGVPSSSSASLPLEIFWSGDDKICLLTTLQQVLVFDLTRGVLAHTIPTTANKKQSAAVDQILHHAASASSAASGAAAANPILQVLVSSSSRESGGGKIQIHEYDAASGKLLRKIKAGSRHDDNDDEKNTTYAAASLRLAVTMDHVIVRQGNQLRILKADTGEKVTKKCKLFKKGTVASNNNNDTAAAVGATVAAGQLGAAVVSAARQIILVNMKTGKVIMAANTPTSTSTSLPSSSLDNDSLELWETSTEESLYYLYHDKVLYKLELSSDKDDSDGKEQVVEVKSKRKIQTNSSIEKQAVLGHGDEIIAVLYKTGQIQLNKISLLSSDSTKQDDIALTWNDPASADKNTTAASSSSSSSTKRKSTSGTHVLGPGQAGGESRTVSEGSAPKRAKKKGDDKKEGGGDKDDDDDGDDEEDNQGPTIAERLQKLEQALHAEEEDDDDDKPQEGKSSNAIKFHPKKATTESLTLVLEQALQSNDKAMLELALTVTNKRILQATCESLQPESLSKLLSALTTRLSQKPTRAVQLSYWLTVVLKSVGRIQQNNNNNNIGQLLRPLRNLLEERVELFPTFYKLRGRLGMMGNLQE